MPKHHFIGTDYDLETGEAHNIECAWCCVSVYHADEPCVDEEQEARADYLVSVHVEESRMEED